MLHCSSLASLVLVCACSSGKAPTPEGDGGTATALTYAPVGCAYTVTPPASRGYTDLFPDDATPVGDPTNATPARVRVGLGGGTTAGQPGYADPTTSAVFTWETAEFDHGAKVKVGSDPNTLSDVHAGYVWTTPKPTIGFGTDEPATNMHEVHVCGLQPGQTYYYEVGGGAPGAEVWSATQSFTTPPAAGKVTIGILGDARDTVMTWQLVHSRMRDQAVAMQLVSGDVVDIGTVESLYTQWLDAIWHDPNDATKFLTLGQQLIVPIAGNHENEAVRFYANFAIPGDGPYAKTYASFNVGSAHVVMVDDQPFSTQQGSDEANQQLAWLDKDLAAASTDRQNHPFIIAISHRGLYSTSLHSTDGDVLLARASLAPLYDKYHVDIAFNGHDHEYERSKPLNAGTPPDGAPVVQQSASQGTTYIICAGAGADPYAVGTASSAYRQTSTAFGSGTPYIGLYGILVLNGNQLTFTAYGLKGAGGADDTLDTLQLTH
jgi:hypothetical protein